MARLARLLPVLLLAAACGDKTRAAPAPQRVPVSVEKVARRDVPQVVRGLGNVKALQSVVLRPQVEGVLAAVLFKEGQTVHKGDLLARIDDRAFNAELAAARAEKARNQAQLGSLRADLARYEALVADDAIARQTVDQQKAQVAQLEAELRRNDAAIASAEVNLSYTRITSPIDGRVGLRRIDAGNLVRPTDAQGLFAVTQVDPIAILFTLPQDQLGRVQPFLADPAAAAAVVVAFDREAGARLGEGKLAVIDNEIDAQSGTLSLKAEMPNADGKLWPGQSVTVELTTGVARAALVVSARAVQRGRDGPYVFRVEAEAAKVVPVKVAWQDAELAVIAAGIAEGDTVVVDGHSRLKPGSKVSIASGSTGGAPEAAR